MKTRLLSIAFAALVVAAYFCLLLKSHGQAFTPRRPFILASGTSTVNTNPESVLPFGMKYWWKATDLSNSPVSIWTDRIQGYTWVQSNTNYQPGWDASNGVKFNNTIQPTNVLIGTNVSISTSIEPWLIIFQYHSTAGGDRPVLAEGGSTHFLDMCNPGFLIHFVYGCSWLPWNTFRADIISANKSFNKHWTMTNGVECLIDTSQFNSLGGPNQTMGASDQGGGAYISSYVDVMEVIVWTNTLAGVGQTNYWDATTVSNVHWYATNTWPHSP